MAPGSEYVGFTLFSLIGNLGYSHQYMDSERSSIFVFDPLNKQLTSYSSLDLGKLEIRIPKSTGVAGWVFEHRMPAVINDAYAS
jgi:hypothetical protein